ncbi:MAG: alanine racemase [Spirochaetales bacterium]|nr:alanine racemase [Spirochaetales bacterium]
MRATHAIIHLDHLLHNLDLIHQQAGSGCKICLAVKANAYGHGIVEISKTARKWGVEWFGVATVEEGVMLRKAGIDSQVLLLGIPQFEEFEELVLNDITTVVGDAEMIEALEKTASRLKVQRACHLKIDTGMGRIGCKPGEALALARLIHQSPVLRLEGICTHFPGSDFADKIFAEKQIEEFDSVIRILENEGITAPLIHAANSGAIIGLKKSYFNMVRPGIMAYGYYPSIEQPRNLTLKPVMELKTRVSFIKKVPSGTPLSYGMTYKTSEDCYIATLPIGYGDGYSRLLSNRGRVLIKGQSYPVVGRVCMDQCLVNLGPRTSIKRHDEVVLFGPDPRGPSAEEIADLMNTIPYETTCLITNRVPREFKFL